MRRSRWRWPVLVLVAATGCSGPKNDPAQGEVKMTATGDGFDPDVRRRIEAAVVKYIEREQRWAREEYQIEPRRRTPDRAAIVVDVVHRDDATPGPGGGAGKSLQLYVNATTFAVEKMLHFQ